MEAQELAKAIDDALEALARCQDLAPSEEEASYFGSHILGLASHVGSLSKTAREVQATLAELN